MRRRWSWVFCLTSLGVRAHGGSASIEALEPVPGGAPMSRSALTTAWPKRIACAVIAALAMTLAYNLTPLPAAAAAVRIMPLGDSITGGPGCWRALLWDRLQRNGFTDIDFVGT